MNVNVIKFEAPRFGLVGIFVALLSFYISGDKTYYTKSGNTRRESRQSGQESPRVDTLAISDCKHRKHDDEHNKKRNDTDV